MRKPRLSAGLPVKTVDELAVLATLLVAAVGIPLLLLTRLAVATALLIGLTHAAAV